MAPADPLRHSQGEAFEYGRSDHGYSFGKMLEQHNLNLRTFADLPRAWQEYYEGVWAEELARREENAPDDHE